MDTHAFLNQAVVLLAAAVIGVWIAKRLGLGAVLGYLAAGFVVGPWGLAYFQDSDSILHFAELGVVLLLFVIGLELRPRRLWSMRHSVLGLGLSQVLVSGAALGGLAYLAGLPPISAGVVGLTLGLSSTAFALQVLGERKELATHHGRAAFSVLLLQDIAVIPMLAAIPLLPGPNGGGTAMDAGAFTEALKVAGVLVAVVVVGRVALQHAFRIAAETHTREIFAAAALLTVVGTALLMDALGLSMGLGAFLAGVLLADTHYRHAIEADIEPFKGLLMGLFFLAVGMSVNLGVLAEQPAAILGGVVALVVAKGAIIFPLARLNGLSNRDSLTTAVAISQGGEFAFVLLTAATAHGVVADPTADVLTLIVIGSMVTTPLLLMALDRARRRPLSGVPDAIDGEAPQVIVAGLGRFGHIVGRVLRANGITFTALDHDPQRVERMKHLGTPAFYGDASRLDVLRTAGADDAAALVVALDDVDQAERIVAAAKQHFPRLKVYARAHNREHAQRLMGARADAVVRETFLASLDLSERLLTGLGLPQPRSREAVAEFREHDENQLAASLGEDVGAREPANRDAEGLAARDPAKSA
ncbi:Kef-type potassium/proton antiporter, CPA2 family [Limimonas halophila]|uniref:Kef-type potassium/proton antiporter, CPA2 family n=1 Tax=Limimonas halophila TaxID=1082479 RepID=A0A1G7UU46_9PROT|nr:monovalent cation:proton antiporter-2 (CPA2) family protein [Limimonas halophila]SDG50260.1 Kef-type potassium/proton antiporter, CPA2 family [Limimonas halophila]